MVNVEHGAAAGCGAIRGAAVTGEKRGRGRPKMAPGEKRDAVFAFRVTVAELAVIREAAEREGVPASDWARDVLLAASEERRFS
jgi:hypothetical protein